MLTVTDIAQRIADPKTVQINELQDLHELAAKHPYSQLFSMLYLKGLGQSGDVRFEEELQKHSFRIGDRVQLYDLIQSVEMRNHSENENEEEKEEEHEALLTTIEVETAEDIENEGQDKNEDENESEKESEKEKENEIAVRTIDPVEENILHHVYAANYQLEDLNDDELAALKARSEEHQEDSDTKDDIDEVTKPTVDINAKQSFTSWLTANKNHHETPNPDKETINSYVNDFSSFDPSQQLFGEIEKPKKEFYSPAKNAKKSLDEEGLPVSETLAKIYVLQGNYPKAIDAYEQLSLNYPEKKIFFANLIEDLQKKINSK